MNQTPIEETLHTIGLEIDAMKTAVELLNGGKVPTAELLGEVFTLDDFDEALRLLKREHPEREAVRVTIRHC